MKRMLIAVRRHPGARGHAAIFVLFVLWTAIAIILYDDLFITWWPVFAALNLVSYVPAAMLLNRDLRAHQEAVWAERERLADEALDRYAAKWEKTRMERAGLSHDED